MIANDKVRCPMSPVCYRAYGGKQCEFILFYFLIRNYLSMWMQFSICQDMPLNDMLSFISDGNIHSNEKEMSYQCSSAGANMTSIDYINQHFVCCWTGNVHHHLLRFIFFLKKKQKSGVQLDDEHWTSLFNRHKHTEIVFAITKTAFLFKQWLLMSPAPSF